MHHGGALQFEVKRGETWGTTYWILPHERVLSFQVPDVCAKFRENRINIAIARERTHRQTEITGDLIICPHSNGRDNIEKSKPTLAAARRV